MTDNKRAFELHDLALSVVRTMGKPALGDCSSMTECKVRGLTIRYWPKERWLDVICDERVLTVERWPEPCRSSATFQEVGKVR